MIQAPVRKNNIKTEKKKKENKKTPNPTPPSKQKTLPLIGYVTYWTAIG